MDPIQTAKELLELHRSKRSGQETGVADLVEDVDDSETEEEVDEVVATLIEAASKKSSKVKEQDDEDDEDEDDEDEDEDEVEEGKIPPQFLKNIKKKKNGKNGNGNGNGDDEDDEDEVEEATAAQASATTKPAKAKKGVILDVDDNETAGVKATDTPKGKDDSAKHKTSVKNKSSAASAKIDKAKMKEHIDVMFGDEDLSEDFKGRATTIFEAALSETLETYIEAVDAHYVTQLEEEATKVRSELTEKINDYMGYVVDEWIKENELSLERGLRGDIAESFMTGLKDLFVNHYIDVPEEKYDLLEGMNDKFDALTDEVNTQIQTNVELKKEIQELRCNKVLAELSDELVDTEKEKFRSLAEGIDFDSVDSYREKLEVIKDGYFNSSSESSMNFEGDAVETETEPPKAQGSMLNYSDAISRHMNR